MIRQSRSHTALALALSAYFAASADSPDPRNIQNGSEIPSEGYCDQPYVVVLADGTWLCTMTTGAGQEGATQQHVVSTRSTDRGKTWEGLTAIEPPGPPESSWVTPLLLLSGRVYAFYDYNADNVRSVRLSNGGETKRVDTLGQFVFKHSDDGGRTWSPARHRIPIRNFEIDRENIYAGAMQFMWSVAKPLIYDGYVYIGLSKVGNFGEGFIARSEGVILKSNNILYESDPTYITWETLPSGDIGLRAPVGLIAEEQNITWLTSGALYCTYRTTQGHPCHAYSRDGGHTWTPPAYMTYTPGGRLVKHPRAANFVRRLADGRYVYWFHNHGGKTYEGRNPVWISGGIERDGALHWSQPEILLYDETPATRMSYPDFVEADGRLFVTETQKETARVHEVPRDLLDSLFTQFGDGTLTRDAMQLELTADQCAQGAQHAMPTLPLLRPGQGFTIDLALAFKTQSTEEILIDARDTERRGIAVVSLPNGRLALDIRIHNETHRYESDPITTTDSTPHRVTIIADGGPKVLLFVVDEKLCDGGDDRPQGWYRLDSNTTDLNGAVTLRFPLQTAAAIQSLRVYARALGVSEAIGNQRVK